MQYTHITIKIFSMSFIIIVIYCYIKYICQVGVKTKVRVMGVKRIGLGVVVMQWRIYLLVQT